MLSFLENQTSNNYKTVRWIKYVILWLDIRKWPQQIRNLQRKKRAVWQTFFYRKMRKITKYGYKHFFFSNYFQINSSHAWPLKCKRHFSSHFISKQKLYFTDTLFFFFFFYFYVLILNHCSKIMNWSSYVMLFDIFYPFQVAKRAIFN